MTYRDRREARADRLEEWAEKREQRAEADARRSSEMASVIPFGQPILVGHHSEGRDRRYRARIGATMDRAIESSRKAESMNRRAGTIRDQLETSIYDDDPDAVEALEARLVELEAKREQIKAHNKKHRGDKLCPCPPDCDCRNPYRVTRCGCTNHPMPSYVLSNLGGNIKRNRDRLEQLRKRNARAESADAAGGTLVEHLGHGYTRVTFADKPAREVLETLKAAGYRWGKGSWVGQTDALPDGIEPDDSELGAS